MSNPLEIRHIDGSNSLENYQDLLDQSIKLYIDIFRDPPYNEDFNYHDVMNEFTNYIVSGCFLLAIIDFEVVGFMCSSVGMDHVNDEIEADIIKAGINIETDIYISELGVSKNHRGKKISKKLINKFMTIYPYQNMFLRTGVNNNDHVINLYKKYNFEVTDIREFVTNKRANGQEEVDERLYMFKKQCVSEEKQDDGYKSGAEEFYGTSCHYDNDDNNHNDTSENYKSGSEYLY